MEQALVFTMQALLLFQVLHSPMQQQALTVLRHLAPHIDEAVLLQHWQSLVGNLPLPDLTSAETACSLIPLCIEFLQAPTWEASRQFLHRHPVLLSSFEAILAEEQQ